MKYFDLFFNDMPFYRSLDTDTSEEGERLRTYLKHPSQILFQREINKWLRIVYKQHVDDHYRKRLSGNNVDFILLQSVLNELMVAYFVMNYLGMGIKEHNPPAVRNKLGEWLFTKNSQEMFVEVKTPWEERRVGTFCYSQFAKLDRTLRWASEQKPSRKIPFVIFITEDLNLPTTHYDHELLDALYGESKLVGSYRNGCLENIEDKIVGQFGLFQKDVNYAVSAVAILKFMVWLDFPEDYGKYHFRIYHNPNCCEECRLNIDWFERYPQFVPNYARGTMEWIGKVQEET